MYTPTHCKHIEAIHWSVTIMFQALHTWIEWTMNNTAYNPLMGAKLPYLERASTEWHVMNTASPSCYIFE